MIVWVLTNCHKQYTWNRSICLLHTLQVLYMCTLCDSTNINAIIEFVPNWNVSTQNAFSLPFAAILVSCAPSGEMRNYILHTAHHKRKLRISWSIGAITYCYLKCIVYDKLLKPRQSFWITLYGGETGTLIWTHRATHYDTFINTFPNAITAPAISEQQEQNSWTILLIRINL